MANTAKYRRDQEAWVQETGLRPGDRVLVVMKPDDYCGWDRGWTDFMDLTIGKVIVVDAVSEHGVYCEGWFYPFFVLIKQ